MKTDRYKDWESRFFEGEELTPEEHLFLKNESDNPYFSFLNEEKQEKLNISFEDFLKKTEEPKIVPLPIVKRKSYTQYWMAASLVLLMGITGLWMFNNPENIAPQVASHTEKPKKGKARKVVPVEETQIQQTVLVQQDVQPRKRTNEKKNTVDNQESKMRFASHQPKQIKTDNQSQNQVNSDSDYNPNYVIINGKPIYNEQEAIAITEDTFNYFASNVTQTINHAESAQNQSLDFYRILNF
ncbi:hypothetical protein [Epilithonimonas sp.]|uniref:hypothetical protein n=1 Tax=Epilithonimonas sp. TaxID=2894511 RepID=UPI00289B9995|nr:hypothetical protein [Epilithonimonas sp.]